MPRQLPPGYFYGETLKRYEVPDFALWERAYPPGFKTPTHSHKRALLCFVIRGEYTETYGRRMRACKPSTLLFPSRRGDPRGTLSRFRRPLLHHRT